MKTKKIDSKGGHNMNKKKVFIVALAVCLVAIVSLGTLAWFTDEDSITNNFYVAGSEDENPDDIFSVDVWEGTDPDNPDQDGIEYNDILPGDTLEKVAHVKNTGSYDQYIRVKITVSDAKVWQDAYEANIVPVTEFVNVNLDDYYGITSSVDTQNDEFVYYLYYNNILPEEDANEDVVIFTEAYICKYLDRDQAVAMTKDGFAINVTADAVQAEHVGNNVYEAFKTVGMEIPVNTAYVNDKDELITAFATEGVNYIVLNANIDKMYAAHKIIGTTAELYLNNKSLETASGATVYGVTMTGELAISGYGSLEFGSAGAKVDALTIYGGTITARRADLVVYTDGTQITLP